MKMSYHAVALIILGFLVNIAAAQVGPVLDPYSGASLYLVGSSSTGWTAAQSQAQSLGGNLITIHSAAENQFIVSTFFHDFTSAGGPNLTDGVGLWLGLYDPTGITRDDGPGGAASQHAADFVWVNGESAGYRPWNFGEPNDSNQGEYYGMIWGPGDSVSGNAPVGTWNDIPDTFPNPSVAIGFFGVAEVVPEPASIALLAFGATTLLSRRRR